MALGDPSYKRQYSTRTWLIFMGVATFVIMACGMSVYVGYDVSCHNDATRWLPDYPDSELISEEYTFFRPWGIGETTRILYSPDRVVDVRGWYVDNNVRIADETGQRPTGSLALIRFFVSEAENGDGSQIVLYSECASDIIPW